MNMFIQLTDAVIGFKIVFKKALLKFYQIDLQDLK